jgi:hypothetical protein
MVCCCPFMGFPELECIINELCCCFWPIDCCAVFPALIVMRIDACIIPLMNLMGRMSSIMEGMGGFAAPTFPTSPW